MHWIDWVVFGITIIVFVIGSLATFYQIFRGQTRTGLNDKYIWGLNIQGFFTLSTLAVGILTIVSSYILLGFSDPGPTFEMAVALAFGFLIGSQLLLASDLGKPFRAFYILKGRNFVSPLTWDFISLLILTVLSFIYMLGVGLYQESEVLMRLWALVTLIFSLLCNVVHVLFFISRVEAGYNSQPFSALKTFACSLWGGAAILVLLISSIRLHQIFVYFMLIGSILVFITSTGAFISLKLGKKEHNNIKFLSMNLFIIAALAFEIVFFKEKFYLEHVISVLVLLAIFLEKYEFITEFQKKPTIPLPYSKFEKSPSYRPSIIEWGSLLAGTSLSVVIFYGVTIFKSYILPFIIFHVL